MTNLDPGVLNGIFGIGGAVVGSIVAFLLAERAAKNREERADKRQRDSIRLILGVEVDHNLTAFRAYWKIRQGHDRNGTDWARLLVRNSPPAWSTSVWEALAPSMPIGMSADEIALVNGIDSGLARNRSGKRRSTLFIIGR